MNMEGGGIPIFQLLKELNSMLQSCRDWGAEQFEAPGPTCRAGLEALCGVLPPPLSRFQDPVDREPGGHAAASVRFSWSSTDRRKGRQMSRRTRRLNGRGRAAAQGRPSPRPDRASFSCSPLGSLSQTHGRSAESHGHHLSLLAISGTD